jgi:hypothetical protein
MPPVEARPIQTAACDELIRRVARLAEFDPPMDIASHPETNRLLAEASPARWRDYKLREDLVDAAIYTWAANYWHRRGADRNSPLREPRATRLDALAPHLCPPAGPVGFAQVLSGTRRQQCLNRGPIGRYRQGSAETGACPDDRKVLVNETFCGISANQSAWIAPRRSPVRVRLAPLKYLQIVGNLRPGTAPSSGVPGSQEAALLSARRQPST